MTPLIIRFSLLVTTIAFFITGCSVPSETKAPTVVTHATKSVVNASLSSHGRYALVAPTTSPAGLWDLQQNVPLFAWQNSKDDATDIIASGFSPEDHFAATAESSNIALWNVQTGKIVAYWLVKNPITDLAVSREGHYVLLGFENGEAQYVEMVNGLSTRAFEHAQAVRSVALSADERYAATGSDDKTAVLWDLQTGQNIHIWKLNQPVTKVLISPNSQFIFAATSAGKIGLWQRETAKAIKNHLESKEAISAVAFSRDEKALAVSTLSGKITVLDLPKGVIKQSFNLPVPQSNKALAVRAIAFSEDGQRILTEDSEGHGYQFVLNKTIARH